MALKRALECVLEAALFMCALSSQVLKTLHKLKDMDITVDILSVSLLQILRFLCKLLFFFKSNAIFSPLPACNLGNGYWKNCQLAA